MNVLRFICDLLLYLWLSRLIWYHKAQGKSFQLFDTNWKKIKHWGVVFCLFVLFLGVFFVCFGFFLVVFVFVFAWRFLQQQITAEAKLMLWIDLLWVSECFFCLLAPRLPWYQVRQSWERWGVGGEGLRVGSGGGYMAEFPRMLAKDEKDKEILFFWTRGFSAWLLHCWGDELSGWDFINNSYGDWGQ